MAVRTLALTNSRSIANEGGQLGQARRDRLTTGVDGAVAERGGAARGPLDHRPAAAAEPGVDPEHPHPATPFQPAPNWCLGEPNRSSGCTQPRQAKLWTSRR